jgi:hypothetical protein
MFSMLSTLSHQNSSFLQQLVCVCLFVCFSFFSPPLFIHMSHSTQCSNNLHRKFIANIFLITRSTRHLNFWRRNLKILYQQTHANLWHLSPTFGNILGWDKENYESLPTRLIYFKKYQWVMWWKIGVVLGGQPCSSQPCNFFLSLALLFLFSHIGGMEIKRHTF